MNPSHELYQQILLTHYKNPKNYCRIKGHSLRAEEHNPLCGDKYTIYLKVNGANRVEDVSFTGEGCAISKAAASLMTTTIKGKKWEEVKDIFAQFQRMVKGTSAAMQGKDILGELKIFSNVLKYPSRVKCAMLCWNTMFNARENKKTVSTKVLL